MATGGQTTADQTGFDWKTPVHQRVSAIILALLVAAVIAGFAYAIVRFAKPYPKHFDHSTWIHHPDWRRFMLNDLLTDKICPGTPARRVLQLLGPPDDVLPVFGQPATLDWEIGTTDPLYIDFRVNKSGRKVVYDVLPDFWPPTGCWK